MKIVENKKKRKKSKGLNKDVKESYSIHNNIATNCYWKKVLLNNFVPKWQKIVPSKRLLSQFLLTTEQFSILGF